MARKYLMTWDGEPNFRWQKMRLGQWYRVTCEALGLPRAHWTKELSYQAANDWWNKQNQPSPLSQTMRDTVGSIPADRLRTMVEQGEVAKAILAADGNVDELLADVDGLVADVLTDNWDDQHRMNILGMIGEKIGTVGPQAFRLELNAKRFLELESAKKNKPRTFGELSESITNIIRTTYNGQALLWPEMDVRRIDKITVENFYLFLRNESGWEPTQQKKQWGFFKRLIKHLFSAELIEMPRNLVATPWEFRIIPKKIKEYDRNEVIATIKRLPDRLKLYALLGLNCGMISVDVGNLKKEEIDFKNGRIKRKRTKTETEDDVPEVDYSLWPITLKLLKQCLSDDPVLALTTKNGKPLVTNWIDAEGKGHEKNMVRQQWKRAQTEIPHKAFRTIGATVIGSRADGGTVGYYLGHSPKSIQDKHYKAPDRGQFDEIVSWLGQQFKLVK